VTHDGSHIDALNTELKFQADLLRHIERLGWLTARRPDGPLLKGFCGKTDVSSVFSRYRALFAVPGFARLLVSSVVGRLPSGMFSLAILLFVREQTGSFLVAGLAVGAFTLAGAIVSPVQGAAVDRLGQPRVLLPAAVVQGALLVALVLVLRGGAPVAAVVALAALAGAVLPPISACIRALWPEVAPDAEALEAAYALDAITQEIIYTLGPLLVGVVAVLLSPAASVLLCATITVAGTAFFAASTLSRRWQGGLHERSRGGALASSGLRVLLGSAVFGGMVVGAAEIGLPALAVHVGSRGAAGVLLALFSVGSMLGGLAYTARSWRLSIGSRYTAILLAVEISMTPLIVVHSLPAGLLFSVVAGLGVAPMLSSQFSLVGALAPAGTTTEAFTWHRAATVGGIAGGSALGGALVDTGGVSAAFALGCTGAALAAVLAVFGRRRIDPTLSEPSQGATVRIGPGVPAERQA
jgi:MFS family permease